jgi:hypothetical protein
MSTDLAVVDHEGATLFAGATPNEVIAAATQAADALHAVIQAKRLFQVIGGRQHILIEGWQALGSLVGVYAVKDGGVLSLPWPPLPAAFEAPADPGREPPRAAPTWTAWRAAKDRLDLYEKSQRLLAARDAGLSYGFTVAFKAVKDGREVGWGEGRCTRSEANWAMRDDYALAAMAGTRGQSRCLRGPLGFVVSLAGYAATPAEESPPASASQWGSEADETAEKETAQTIQEMHPSISGFDLVNLFKTTLGVERLPLAAVRMIAAVKWGITEGAQIVEGNASTGDDHE